MALNAPPESDDWFTREPFEPRSEFDMGDDRFGPMPGGVFEADDAPPRAPIKAQPFVWIDPATIPKRQWVYGRHLIRKFVSATVAPGGVGKSSLSIVEALSLVSGKGLLGIIPPERCRVWLYNGEDPLEELQRRVMAACLHFDLGPDDIGDRLFLNSGRDQGIVIAEQNGKGITIYRPVVDEVKATIRENGIDVFTIDPFVSTHRVGENDNGAIDIVSKEWAGIANDTNAAGDLVHHVRKTNGSEITVEDGRGAVALLNTVRSARVLNPMSKDEVERAGIDPKDRRRHFRVDYGKGNLALPSDVATWHRLASVDLGNGKGNLDFGDSVGVVEAWQWPDPLEEFSVADLRAAQAAVRGGLWRENVQAKNWVGQPIAYALRLNPEDRADREKVKRCLKIWIGTGMFVVVTGKNEKGRDTPFVEVGEEASD